MDYEMRSASARKAKILGCKSDFEVRRRVLSELVIPFGLGLLAASILHALLFLALLGVFFAVECSNL